jgi:hypothetical protein
MAGRREKGLNKERQIKGKIYREKRNKTDE